jgi:hypothetical protein
MLYLTATSFTYLIYIYYSIYRPFGPFTGHADYSLFKEKLAKENLGLAVLDTYTERRDDVTSALYIYSLCSPRASGSL